MTDSYVDLYGDMPVTRDPEPQEITEAHEERLVEVVTSALSLMCITRHEDRTVLLRFDEEAHGDEAGNIWFNQNGVQNYVNEELKERFNQTLTKARLLRRALHGLGVGETTIKVERQVLKVWRSVVSKWRPDDGVFIPLSALYAQNIGPLDPNKAITYDLVIGAEKPNLRTLRTAHDGVPWTKTAIDNYLDNLSYKLRCVPRNVREGESRVEPRDLFDALYFRLLGLDDMLAKIDNVPETPVRLSTGRLLTTDETQEAAWACEEPASAPPWLTAEFTKPELAPPAPAVGALASPTAGREL